MITKKSEKGKCPFLKLKVCSEECILYRKGVRFTDDAKADPIPFEACALNVIADNLEAMHNRTYMLQKEVGDTKNVMAISILKDLGLATPKEVERQAMKIIHPDQVDSKVLIEDSKN